MIRATNNTQVNQTNHCHQQAAPQTQNNQAPAGGTGGPGQFNAFGAAQQSNTLSDLSAGWQGFGGHGGPQPRVAVIDDFNSAHGNEVSGALQRSGAQTLNFNIGQGGSRSGNIAASLQDIARRLDQGEDIDAVNLSQQDFVGDGNTQAIQQAINYIQSRHGVPVVVAAGNGRGQQNKLAQGAALVASNARPGTDFMDPNSSFGNIAQSATTTSVAAALVAARAGQLRNQGFDINSIVANLQSLARFQGGALD